MIRRSSMIAALVAALTFAVTAEAATIPSSDNKPPQLSLEQAKAKGRYFAKREKANKYGARNLVGGAFYVDSVYCGEPDPDGVHRQCHYDFRAAEPFEIRDDGTRVTRVCTVKVEVFRRTRDGRSRVTGKRLKPSCRDAVRRPRPGEAPPAS